MGKVRKLFVKGQISFSEALLLLCLLEIPSDLIDFTLSSNYYAFTEDGKTSFKKKYGINKISLEAYYSLNKKFNCFDYKTVLEDTLIKASKDRFNSSRVLEVVNNILWFQNNGKATFEIDCVKVLEEASKVINKNLEFYSLAKSRHSSGCETPDIDYIIMYNKIFKDKLGFDVFSVIDKEQKAN